MKLSQILTTALLTVSASTLFAAEETSKASKPLKTEVKTTTATEAPTTDAQTKSAESPAVKEHSSETVLLKPDAIKYKIEEDSKKK